jgi:hypothetical protein
MPQHSLDDYAEEMRDAYALADDLAGGLVDVLQYLPSYVRDDVDELLARWRLSQETRF